MWVALAMSGPRPAKVSRVTVAISARPASRSIRWLAV